MPALSLRIILEDGAVTRVMKFPSGATVAVATQLVEEKVLTGSAGKDYGLFLTSADDELSGIWLEGHRPLDYYLLKDGDSLQYRCRVRTLRIRMLDGAVKTMQVDESKPVEHLMMIVCGRLGITNYEEYGFCREDDMPMESQPATGTLTLKRKPPREKDAAMQQLGKKFKTDDHVEWLEQHKTLRESSVAPTETLLLKRRLFYSDRKVDSRDPVQLNLLFVQARDAVLEGRHPVTEAQAMEFAGIQCQVQYGDYQEDKHKPGFIENLNEFLPQQYSNSWGAEKKVLKEYSKHPGLSPIEAKHLYTKTVRDLPTYGVTFFLVKEIQQKGKKKLVPRLLGISAESVLRLDETTKEVLQVWPLTQVKTYKAGKGELFTLNFGDYSDKEYCVKTNDAYRIRDILQGYIDLIRKRMAGAGGASGDTGGVIYSATVESSKGNVMEVVSHSANKIVETSFVGPTKIISYEHGSTAQMQGTQIMTAQDVIVTSRQHNRQVAMTGGGRTDMSTDTVKKLNEFNGKAVQIVKLLTDPDAASIEEARRIIEELSRDMPALAEGVKECIEKQPDEAAKKKLALELSELQHNIALLSNFRDPSEAQENAMKVADLTTQMYFALDPRSKRRSDYITRSRKSFIDDERTQASLQRASFINAVAGTSQAIDDAKDILNEKYEGRSLTPEEVEALERAGRDQLANLNAAIARFNAAHKDPKNIDYAAAASAMNTIKELMPELAKDAQALSAVQDGKDRRELLQQLRELCDAAGRVCRNTGCDDLEKLHDEANNYAQKAGKLVFTFGRGVHPDKESEIIELAKEAEDKVSVLAASANKLASEVDDPGAPAAAQAAARCAGAARGLTACARLTAPSIQEPHCRSALSAASEDLSSSAKLLEATCRPLLEHPAGQGRSEAIKHQSVELAKALERLNNAVGDLDGAAVGGPSPAERERRRLQFVTTLATAQEALDNCDKIMHDNGPLSHSGGWLGDTLPARLGALNAAIASLVAATRDGENPDYAAADAAMATIEKYLPGVVNDIKWYSSNLPEKAREELLADLKALCDATRTLALNTRHGEDASDAVAEFARASGKLTYVFDRKAVPEKENQIIDLAKASCERTSELLANVYALAAEGSGGAAGELDARGARGAGAARELLTTAQLTAPTIHSSPCKRVLAQSAQALSSALDHLAKSWPAACQPGFEAQGKQLDAQRKVADEEIQKLLAALNEIPEHSMASNDPIKKKKRVQFNLSLSHAQDAVERAEMEIAKPVSSKPLTPEQAQKTQHSLADKLATLNAAIAALMVAMQDESDPDYQAAESASAVIQKLMPEVVDDTKALSSGKSEAEIRALLDELRALCAATKALSTSAGEGNAMGTNEAVAQYANAARKLTFVCIPRAQEQDKTQDLKDKSEAVFDKSSELTALAQQLGGSEGVQEGGRGAARAAAALRATAQLTSSSLHDPRCRAALHRAAAALARAVAQLDSECRPLSVDPGLRARLAAQRQEFDAAVAELMRTIEDLEGDSRPVTTLTPEQEKRRLKFVATRSSAKTALEQATQELDKSVKAAPLTPPQANALQSSLSDRLATLNAAIAALLAATRDAEKPDYAAAESASATIQELMPDLVKDAKTLDVGKKDKAAQSATLESLRALCEATNALIGATESGKEQDINDATRKFTDASGKLVYVFNPRADPANEDQIIELSKSTCQKTSDLLAQVNQLAGQVGGEQADELDARGAKVADAAQSLLTTAELTAASVSSPLCQSSLLTAAAALSSALEQLMLARPVTSRGQDLQAAKAAVDHEIGKLRAAVKGVSADAKIAEELKKKKLQFTTTLASTDAALKAAEMELNEPSAVPLPASAAASLQDSLANRLAALNAAINSLVAATRDHDNPDYVTAESASTTIKELIPDIIKDTKTLSSSKDGVSREEMLAHARALSEAARQLVAGAGQSEPEELNEAVTQFSLASGKLNFVFNPRSDQKKTHQIIEQCKSACVLTSEMLQAQAPAGAGRGARGAGPGERGAGRGERGAAAADAARALLTTAQLNAHTAHATPCQAALLAAADQLATAARELHSPGARGGGGAGGAVRGGPVEAAVDKLKGMVVEAGKVHEAEKKNRLRFIASLAAAEQTVEAAERELTQESSQPYGAPLSPTDAAPLRDSLASRLAALNAAIDSLIAATRDPKHPNYTAAESATKTIQELLPEIIKDTKKLSSSSDEATAAELLAQARLLSEATRLLAAGVRQHSPEELNEAATKFAQASGKLNSVYNPRFEPSRKYQVLDICKSACMSTSAMLQHVQELAARAPEGEGEGLDEGGAAASDAARALLTTAQLTGHSVHSPPCQAALLRAAHALSCCVRALQAACAPAARRAGLRALADQLARDQGAVETELEKLKVVVNEAGKDSVEAKSPTSPARTEEEKRAKNRFSKSVEDARKSICFAEDNLKTYLNSVVQPRASLDDEQVTALNKQMEHKLARANAAAAHLLATRGVDRPDYSLAAKCVGAISDLMPTIVTDAKTLGDLKDGKGRREFLDDTLGLCAASKNLCDTAKNDKKKLTEAALTFGNQSSKLLYAVSTDVDPSQENDVLLRVKAAGDSACRVTEQVDGPAANRCAGQATVFMYTAKLVAPSIQDPECQDSLISASKDLSSLLKTISVSNKPALAAELAALEQILDAVRSDVASGRLVKRRERLVLEDTPFRRLTAQVIEDAKQGAEDTTRPAEARRALADFANKLTDALRLMDLANARCKNAPRDMKKREDLENAVLNIQQLVLQERPRPGAEASQDNIVDLADFLKAVSSDAERLAAVTPALSTGAHARAAAAVAAQCAQLCACAARAVAPAHGEVPLDADHAAQECISRVQKINTAIECCPEGAEKSMLKMEARPLNESSTLLQFANQSALATMQCVALDEALSDLADLEHRIDRMLQPRHGESHVYAQVPSQSMLRARAALATAAAGAGRGARELAPAYTRYVAELRARGDVTDNARRLRLAEHLKKLHDRLKLLTMESSRHVATWRAPRPAVAAITDDILKELDNAEAVIESSSSHAKSVMAHEDLKRLLLPVDSHKVEGDKKQLETKLESSATKLNSMAETIMLSVGKPESLARSAHVTAESAVQLAAIARALKTVEDPTKHSRIEEAAQEMCFVTYNLLKTAESASHEPNSFESRRRLRDACRSLTDAINKLVRTSSSADKLQRECNELGRSLQLRQCGLQARPTCSLPYAECIAALQAQHAAIENLKSEKQMSREEFCRSLDLLAAAVANDVDFAEQCAYLLSVSEQHPELAKEGMFDAERIQRLVAAAQDSCFRVTRPGVVDQAKEESSILSKQLFDLKQAVQECSGRVKDQTVKRQLEEAGGRVDAAGVTLQAMLNVDSVSVDKLTPPAFAVIEALSALHAATEQPALAPPAAPSAQARQRSDEVLQHSKELLTRASGLMRAVRGAESQQAMTWVMFNTYTKGVCESSDQLVTCIRNNGQNAGLIEGALEVEEETDLTTKSYVQTQVLIANKWLQKPVFKPQIKSDGEAAARNVIEIGKKMMNHAKGAEQEELRHLVEECESLLARCGARHGQETSSLLMDRLKDLAKAIDRCVVTMVVEDLIEDEEPLADLETFIDAENDAAKRKFILERKIADLMAHLGRVTRTARVVADGHGDGAPELTKCTDQASLLAPMLVKAAEQRIIRPDERAVAEEYRTQLAQYSDSLAKVRDLCDRAVDPMQFVQTAEETMQRIREESASHHNDLQKCTNTSTTIRKLANRVINVSMSSKNAQRDPELMRALSDAQQRLRDSEPARELRASKMPDWKNSIAEILRATGEVEAVLGGELIFNKLPEPDQPIYNAARNLHTAVREWSARDNEIVAVAKRSAVLMAKLSDHMHADRKREVISTSKAIVAASHEVARLARKLALECTDMRIRTNLLQVCDQIPLISGQLKMLTTVKGSSLGHQGTEEDIEAMNMLVGNAQNLMMSIQDVVNAAAGASVKIRSQRGGPRIRWVRKTYQYQ